MKYSGVEDEAGKRLGHKKQNPEREVCGTQLDSPGGAGLLLGGAEKDRGRRVLSLILSTKQLLVLKEKEETKRKENLESPRSQFPKIHHSINRSKRGKKVNPWGLDRADTAKV